MGKVIPGVALAAAMLSMPLLVSAQSSGTTGGILFEDYRGTEDVPPNPPSPNFNNKTNPVPAIPNSTNIQRLMALQGLPDAVVDSGRRSTIEWLGRNPELCDRFDIGSTSDSSKAACQKWKMGRIAYTVIRFPVSGQVQFRVAHDDDLKVDFSDQIYIGANYRNATWNFQVGNLTSYIGENQWANLGTYDSPAANSCVLARFVWVNNGGLNHLRLRYRTRNFDGGINSTDGNRQFTPEDFIDPNDTATIRSRCAGVIAAPELELRKVIDGGRIKSDDQFRLNVRIGNSVIVTGDTQGSELSRVLPSANLNLGASSNQQVIIEELPLGSASLPDYAPTARCSKTSGSSPTPVDVTLTPIDSGQAGYSWRMAAPAAGEKTSCTITNTQPSARLELVKRSNATQTLRAGQTIDYTLVASNRGPSPANGSVIADPAVPGISCDGPVRCSSSSGGATCPSASSLTVERLQGDGIPIATFPVGGQLTLDFRCTVTASGY